MVRWNTLARQQWFASTGIVLLLVATASAAVIRGDVTVGLNGADSAGSPSSANGTQVTGKAYKLSDTGVILQIGQGTVINEYRRFRIFQDQGTTVTDPEETSATYTATSDLEVIGRANSSGSAFACQISIYDPAQDVPSDPI